MLAAGLPGAFLILLTSIAFSYLSELTKDIPEYISSSLYLILANAFIYPFTELISWKTIKPFNLFALTFFLFPCVIYFFNTSQGTKVTAAEEEPYVQYENEEVIRV